MSVATSSSSPTPLNALPTSEYDKYLWLVEEAKQAGYDQHVLSRSSSFNVGDVFFTALFAAANDDLAELAALVGAPEAAEARAYAERARAAVAARTGPSGLATDIDLRTGEDLGAGTIAGFAPLIAGQLAGQDLDRLVTLLQGPCWAGHPELRWALPPSTSPCSPHFRPAFLLAWACLASDQLALFVGPGASRR